MTLHRQWLTHLSRSLFLTRRHEGSCRRSLLCYAPLPLDRGGNFFRFLLYGWPLFGEKQGVRERTKGGCGVLWLGCRSGNQPGKPLGHKELRDFPPCPVVSMDREASWAATPKGRKADGGGLASECGHADPRGVSLFSSFPTGDR